MKAANAPPGADGVEGRVPEDGRVEDRVRPAANQVANGGGQLTPLGEGLMRAVNAVKAWAEDHIGEIEASRAAYDARGERPSTAAGGNLGWVAGRLGDVGPAGRGGPPEGARANLLGLPAGVLLEPVVVTALRAAVAHARPAARLVLDAVLEIAPAGRAAAARGGADIRCG
jgi:hypothetical protein